MSHSRNPQSLPSGEEPKRGFYPTGKLFAFLIAFVSAVGGFLFGYDLAIMGGAIVLLKKEFFLQDSPILFGLTGASAVLGCMVGPFFGAWLCDRFGRRLTLIAACVLLGVGSLLTAIPYDIITFIVFRIVGGIGVGLCSIASPMYTNEIAPARWRGGLGFMYQLAIVLGSVLAAAAALLLADRLPDEVSWRWMFASELVFVAIFAVLLFFVPESPRWLVERGRRAEAQRIFARIDGPEFAATEMDQIRKSLAAESGTFAELLAPGLRKALFIGLGLAFFNNYTGWSAMNGYIADIAMAGGSQKTEGIRLFFLAYCFMGLMTLVACGLVDRVGRRPLWLVSSLLMIVANVLTGLVFHLDIKSHYFLPAVFLCAIPHSFALGPLPWLMMSEIFPTRIRARAVAITTTFIWLVCYLAASLFPLLMDLSKQTIGTIAGAFWVFAVSCALAFVFGWAFLPETKGKTLEEITEGWQTPQ